MLLYKGLRVLDGNEFAKSLGWSSWSAAWTKAVAAPPGTQSPGPQHHPGSATGGHWVTIHGRHVFIDDNGHFHFGGPSAPAVDPNNHAAMQAALQGHMSHTTSTTAKGKFEVHSTHTPSGRSANSGITTHTHHVEATYAGFGGQHAWRLELKETSSGNTVKTQRSASSSKAAAEQEAKDMIEQHHADALRQYSQHHVATVQAAQHNTSAPSLMQFHQSVTHTNAGHGDLLATAPGQSASVSLKRAGFGGQHGYRMTLYDQGGKMVSQHALRATGTDYAKMAASMLMHNHLYGTGINVPAGGGKTAQDALTHSGIGQTAAVSGSPAGQLTPSGIGSTQAATSSIASASAMPQNGSTASQSTSVAPVAPITQPTPIAPPPAPPNLPTTPITPSVPATAQTPPATTPKLPKAPKLDIRPSAVSHFAGYKPNSWTFHQPVSNAAGGKTYSFDNPQGWKVEIDLNGAGRGRSWQSMYQHNIRVIDPSGSQVAQFQGSGKHRLSYVDKHGSQVLRAVDQHIQNLASPASVTPITAAPPQNVTPITPGQMPSPVLAGARSYVESQVGSANKQSLNVPQKIDHTNVGSYANQTSSLSSDWQVTRGPHLSGSGNADDIVTLLHKPTGTEIKGTFPAGTPQGSTTHDYTLDVNHNGQFLTQYKQNGYATPRDADYVLGRAVQVAHYLEATHIKKIEQQQKGGQIQFDAPIKQFAWHYAKSAGVQGKPFSLDDTDYQSQANRQKVEAYLRKSFDLDTHKVHGPHGQYTPAQHMVRASFDYIHDQGLNQRDAKILRLATIFHDVGKHAGHGSNAALDNAHPLHSAADAVPHLAQFKDADIDDAALQDVQHLIKYHDAWYDSQPGTKQKYSLDQFADIAHDNRMLDMFRRIHASDAGSIPGFEQETKRELAKGPAGQNNGFLGVMQQRIAQKAAAGTLKAREQHATPQQHTASVQEPDLRPHGVAFGELVQRDKDLPVGDSIPFKANTGLDDPNLTHVYAEVKSHPELNYARALGMAYDGPTGQVVKVYHGSYSHHHRFGDTAMGITAQGIVSSTGGSGENVFGHGIYTVTNGSRQIPSGYDNGRQVVAEVHTGRTLRYDDLSGVVKNWVSAHPHEAKMLAGDQVQAAAALAAGYSTISHTYSGHPMLVVLDPARMRVLSVTDSNGRGVSVNVAGKGRIQHRDQHSHERSTPSSHEHYAKLTGSGRPEGFTGVARTT